MSQAPQNLDPKEREKLNKIVKHEKSTEHIFRLVLHTIEQIIAAIAIIALVAALGLAWHAARDGTLVRMATDAATHQASGGTLAWLQDLLGF